MWLFKKGQKVNINSELEGTGDEEFLNSYSGQELTILECKEEGKGIVEHYFVADEDGNTIMSQTAPDEPFPFIDADLQAAAMKIDEISQNREAYRAGENITPKKLIESIIATIDCIDREESKIHILDEGKAKNTYAFLTGLSAKVSALKDVLEDPDLEVVAR